MLCSLDNAMYRACTELQLFHPWWGNIKNFLPVVSHIQFRVPSSFHISFYDAALVLPCFTDQTVIGTIGLAAWHVWRYLSSVPQSWQVFYLSLVAQQCWNLVALHVTRPTWKLCSISTSIAVSIRPSSPPELHSWQVLRRWLVWRNCWSRDGRFIGRVSESAGFAKHVGIWVFEELHIVLHATISAVTLLQPVFEVIETWVELALALQVQHSSKSHSHRNYCIYMVI